MLNRVTIERYDVGHFSRAGMTAAAFRTLSPDWIGLKVGSYQPGGAAISLTCQPFVGRRGG
jgi:hypothetical protein